jgi:hypothetical protein
VLMPNFMVAPIIPVIPARHGAAVIALDCGRMHKP